MPPIIANTLKRKSALKNTSPEFTKTELADTGHRLPAYRRLAGDGA
jgi:hypothetical protein